MVCKQIKSKSLSTARPHPCSKFAWSLVNLSHLPPTVEIPRIYFLGI